MWHAFYVGHLNESVRTALLLRLVEDYGLKYDHPYERLVSPSFSWWYIDDDDLGISGSYCEPDPDEVSDGDISIIDIGG